MYIFKTHNFIKQRVTNLRFALKCIGTLLADTDIKLLIRILHRNVLIYLSTEQVWEYRLEDNDKRLMRVAQIFK